MKIAATIAELSINSEGDQITMVARYFTTIIVSVTGPDGTVQQRERQRGCSLSIVAPYSDDIAKRLTVGKTITVTVD